MGPLKGRRKRPRAPRGKEYQLCATLGSQQIFLSVRIGGRFIRAMIDSGATGNFMTAKVATENGFRTLQKGDPYSLFTVDGKPITGGHSIVRQETSRLRMYIEGHEEVISFDLIPLGSHKVILGMPWLKDHNPEINWITGQVNFGRCNCKTHRQAPLPPLKKESATASPRQAEACATS